MSSASHPCFFIDPNLGTNIILLSDENTFDIIVGEHRYCCSIYRAMSSKVIADFFRNNPEDRVYEYQFGGSTEYFQTICDYFNNGRINFTTDNFDSIRDIATNLEIKPILTKIERISKNNEKLEQDNSSIEEYYYWLYHIRELTVNEVKLKILDSGLVSSKHKLEEFIAFLLHVVRSGFHFQPDLVKLVISLNEEANNLNELHFFKQFLINYLLEHFYESQFYCCFIYHLVKEGFIPKEHLITQIILKDRFLISPRDSVQTIKFVQKDPPTTFNKPTTISTSNFSKQPLPQKDQKLLAKPNKIDGNWKRYSSTNSALCLSDECEFSYLFHRNIFIWFYSELIKNERVFQFYIKKELEPFFDYFTAQSLSKYEEIRDLYQLNPPISNAIFNDDIDLLQSIVGIQSPQVHSTIPYDLFQPVETDLTRTLLDFAAQCGSIKCFRYLIVNNAEINDCTAGYAVYGGNPDIIQYIYQKDPQSFRNLNIEHSTQNPKNTTQNQVKLDFPRYFLFNKKVFMSPILVAIMMHHNDIFDWILDTFDPSFKPNDLLAMAYVSIQSCNFYSFLYCINKGLDITNHMNVFLETSKLFKYKKLHDFIRKTFSNTTMEISRPNPGPRLSKVQLLENVKASFNDLFAVLFNKIQKDYDFLNSNSEYALNCSEVMELLSCCCLKRNFLIFQQLFDYYIITCNVSSVSDVFLKACYSGSEPIVQYILSKKLSFEWHPIIDHYCGIFMTNWKIAVLSIPIIDPNLQSSMTKWFAELSEQTKNKDAFEALVSKSTGDPDILFLALTFNDVDLIKTILSRDKELLNYVSPKGTILHKAIQQHHLAIAKYLISLPDIEINISGLNNETPLTLAVRDNNAIEIVLSILHHQKFDPIKSNLNSAFYICQDSNILQLLYSTDSLDVNYQCPLTDNNIVSVKSTLIYSIEKKNEQKCTMVISHKQFDPIRSSALQALSMLLDDPYRESEGFMKIFEQLFTVYNCNVSVILEKAIKLNALQYCKIILSYHAEYVNHLFSFGTALHYAIQNKFMETVMNLISRPEIDINVSNSNSHTALTLATEMGEAEIVSKILAHSTFDHSKSNINYAFFISNDNEILDMLYKNPNLDINYKYDNYKYGKSIQIQNLTTLKSSPSIITSLMYALMHKNHHKLELIISHPNFDHNKSNAKRVISDMIDDSLSEIFKKLIGIIHNVNFSSLSGENFLSYLAKQNKTNLLRIIFSMDLPIANDHLLSLLITLVSEPLTSSSLWQNAIQVSNVFFEMIQLLIQNYNDCFDFQNCLPNGKSFFTMVNQSHPKIVDIYILFLNCGVNPNAPDVNNCYPFEYAIMTNNVKLVQRLIQSNKIEYNTKLSNNNTYLHVAAETSQVMYNCLLQTSYFDANAKNILGITPSEIAKNKAYRPVSNSFSTNNGRSSYSHYRDYSYSNYKGYSNRYYRRKYDYYYYDDDYDYY